ncbi:MAG: hypothetical protein ACP5Q4_06670 [Candidatus Caldatribacteriaceae bacterium]
MKCDLCGQNEATVVVYFVNQKKVVSRGRLFVCRACAEKFSVASLLEKKEELCGLLEKGVREKLSVKGCPFCGFSWVDLWEKGLLGCPYCYSTFEGEIDKEISQRQLGVFHRGKVPVRWLEEQKVRQNISRILAELKKCVDEENYEKAEHFKRLINRLRSRLE